MASIQAFTCHTLYKSKIFIQNKIVIYLRPRFDNSTTLFDDFPHLAELILANCSLEHINHRTFYFLSNLIVLDLSYNKLVTLYRNVQCSAVIKSRKGQI
jgi:hypothetical protein